MNALMGICERCPEKMDPRFENGRALIEISATFLEGVISGVRFFVGSIRLDANLTEGIDGADLCTKSKIFYILYFKNSKRKFCYE